MRLFWREHTPLILFYMIQMLLVPMLYWLSGENRPMTIVLYGVILSSIVLLLYLSFRYISHRKLYQRLNHPLSCNDEEDWKDRNRQAPLAEAINELIAQYERIRNDELSRYRNKTEHHITFINRWVHQMKTPLAVIQLTLPEMNESIADSVQEELERIRKGLEMVIYTSRLERFEQDFTVAAVPLLYSVNEALASNRKLFIRKAITPEIHISEPIQIYTDAKWFLFLLDQILVNAVNYSAGVGKKVIIKAHESGAFTVLSIQDQGIGISKEDLKRVFNPYFTGERGRQYHESTGMGLYLVKEICERLNHEVSIESEPGRGTTVNLKFRNVRL